MNITLVRFLIVGLFLAWLTLSPPPTVSAQQRGLRTYQPRRPTLSPYLDYFRRDVGALDNYNTFRAPRLRRDAMNRQQEFNAAQLSRQVETAQTELEQMRQSALAPTGGVAGFMTHGQYFNLPTGQR